MRRLLLGLAALLIAGPVCAQQVAYPVGVTPPVFVIPASGVAGSGVVTSPQVLAPDGTSGAPAYSFASDPTKGFYSPGSSAIGVSTGNAFRFQFVGLNFDILTDTGVLRFGGSQDVLVGRGGGAGKLNISGASTGSQLKVDALPTVASGFGTSPTVTAGSTPFAGSVVIGTGGVAVTGVVTWGGTAYPSAPFCTYSTTTTNAVTRGTPTTTNLTLNTTTAWTAGDVVSWICVSSK